MTEQQQREARERLEAATPGPWTNASYDAYRATAKDLRLALDALDRVRALAVARRTGQIPAISLAALEAALDGPQRKEHQ